MQNRGGLMVPLFATLGIHGVLAAGLDRADWYLKHRPAPKVVVSMQIVEKNAEPPPPPPPPPAPEPAPAPPPPEPEKRIAKVMKDPPPEAPPPPAEAPPPPPVANPEPPAPGPIDDTPAPYVYRMDGPTTGGGMPVAAGGKPSGSLYGRKGGTGSGKGGGGGPPDSTGTGSQVATVASVKVMPKPIGDTYSAKLGKDYPPDAMKNDIQGPVTVRILVDEHGKVGEAKIVKGLGYGLDEKALEMARRLRFEPARDTADRPIAVRISWTFHFTIED